MKRKTYENRTHLILKILKAKGLHIFSQDFKEPSHIPNKDTLQSKSNKKYGINRAHRFII